MSEPRSPHSTSHGADPFELLSDDDRWMDHIREAEASPVLGNIGDYEVLCEVSRGGQGIVYRARQPGTNREIAIKRLHAGVFATPAARRRFDREVETAAALNHPNIVTAYGLDIVDGEPVFAMEWIDGKPVTKWAAAVRQEPNARKRMAAMMAKVCQAVQHAHLRGVIHRDLKPSNILVDGNDQPHVLDFGLAKSMNALGQGDATLTQTDQFLGTPAYASPEHLRSAADGLDTRSDVYALGVILYEMLSGAFPYDVSGPLPDVLRAVEHDLPRRLSTVASGVPRELEVVVQKALGKEPERRYQSAQAFGEDLERFVRGEPVEAHPPSTMYQLRTLVRRHRTMAVSVGVIVLVLAGSAITATAQALALKEQRDRAVRAEEVAADERDEAERQKQIAQAVNAFLNEDLLASVSPERHGRDVTVMEVLELAGKRMGTRFESSPLVEAAIAMTLGSAFQKLGETDAAAKHFERAVAIYTATSGATATETIEAERALAVNLIEQEAFDEAEERLTMLLDLTTNELGEDHVQTGHTRVAIGQLRLAQGRFAEADTFITEGLDVLARALDPDDRDVLAARFELARVKMQRGMYRDAQARFQAVLADQQRVLGPNHPDALSTSTELAGAYLRSEQNELALQILEQTRDVTRETFGADHPSTLLAMNNLASANKMLGNVAQAEPIFVELLSICRAQSFREFKTCTSCLNNLARLYDAQQRYDESEPLYLEALRRRREVLGEDHPDTCGIKENLAAMYVKTDRLDEARALIEQVLDSRISMLGIDHRETIFSMFHLGTLLYRDGLYEQAQQRFAQAVEHARAALPADSPWIGKYLHGQGTALRELGQLEEAEQALLEAHRLVSAVGPDGNLAQTIVADIVKLYERWDRPGDAASWRQKLHAQSENP